MAELQIPAYGWLPRDYQMGLWTYLENGGKRPYKAAPTVGSTIKRGQGPVSSLSQNLPGRRSWFISEIVGKRNGPK